MARRRELKTIAHGLMSSFVSRNNDVNGFWAIGQIFSLMESNDTYVVEIDLVMGSIRPYNEEFNFRIDHYTDWLYEQVKKRQVNSDHVKEAEIIVTAYPNHPSPKYGQMAPHRMECTCRITDDLGNVHSATKVAWCRPHSSDNEMKREV